MTGPFATAIIIGSLLLAAWALLLVVLNRPPGRALVIAGIVLEAMLLGFLVVGIVQMAGAEQDLARAEFVGYLLACAAVLPAAYWWVREETSRAAAGVLAVVLLLLPILVVRVQQVWAGAGA